MKRCPNCGEPLLYGDPTPKSVEDACKAAVVGTEIPWWRLLDPGKRPNLVRARWRAWETLRKGGCTLTEIGDAFGKDHSTVVYGIRRLKEQT